MPKSKNIIPREKTFRRTRRPKLNSENEPKEAHLEMAVEAHPQLVVDGFGDSGGESGVDERRGGVPAQPNKLEELACQFLLGNF